MDTDPWMHGENEFYFEVIYIPYSHTYDINRLQPTDTVFFQGFQHVWVMWLACAPVSYGWCTWVSGSSGTHTLCASHISPSDRGPWLCPHLLGKENLNLITYNLPFYLAFSSHHSWKVDKEITGYIQYKFIRSFSVAALSWTGSRQIKRWYTTRPWKPRQ